METNRLLNLLEKMIKHESKMQKLNASCGSYLGAEEAKHYKNAYEIVTWLMTDEKFFNKYDELYREEE